jgi:putative AbiEi antitoxin of type IV toxin-antitoxin system
MTEPVQEIMRYVGKHGIVRPRDIEATGLPREYLVRLHGKASSIGLDVESTHFQTPT